jgi:hypothetical protein
MPCLTQLEYVIADTGADLNIYLYAGEDGARAECCIQAKTAEGACCLLPEMTPSQIPKDSAYAKFLESMKDGYGDLNLNEWVGKCAFRSIAN